MLAEEEFWGLTMAQLVALAERHDHAQERDDFRSGLICSVIANVNRGKNQRPLKPTDFMPKKSTNKQTEQMSADQILHSLMMISAASGGDVPSS